MAAAGCCLLQSELQLRRMAIPPFDVEALRTKNGLPLLAIKMAF